MNFARRYNEAGYIHQTSIARTPMTRVLYEILPTAQENKYLRKFSYFIMKLYVVCTRLGDSNEYSQHTIIVWKIEKSLNNRHLLPDLAP